MDHEPHRGEHGRDPHRSAKIALLQTAAPGTVGPGRCCAPSKGRFAPQMTGFTDSKAVPVPLRARM
jgi:hypothetical protein